MNRRVATQLTEDDARLESVREQIKSHASVFDTLEKIRKDILQKKSELTDLIKKTVEQNKLYKELFFKTIETKKQHDALYEEKKLLSKQIESLQSEINLHTSTLDELTKNLYTSQKKYDALLASLQAPIDTSKEENIKKQLNNEIVILQKALSEKTKDLENTNSNLVTITAQLNSTLNQVSSSAEELEKIQSEIWNETTTLNKIRKEVEKEKNDIAIARAELASVIEIANKEAKAIVDKAQFEQQQINLDKKILEEKRQHLRLIKQKLEKESGKVIKVDI